MSILFFFLNAVTSIHAKFTLWVFDRCNCYILRVNCTHTHTHRVVRCARSFYRTLAIAIAHCTGQWWSDIFTIGSASVLSLQETSRLAGGGGGVLNGRAPLNATLSLSLDNTLSRAHIVLLLWMLMYMQYNNVFLHICLHWGIEAIPHRTAPHAHIQQKLYAK